VIAEVVVIQIVVVVVALVLVIRDACQHVNAIQGTCQYVKYAAHVLILDNNSHYLSAVVDFKFLLHHKLIFS
jgi:hypothetical protein